MNTYVFANTICCDRAKQHQSIQGKAHFSYWTIIGRGRRVRERQQTHAVTVEVQLHRYRTFSELLT